VETEILIETVELRVEKGIAIKEVEARNRDQPKLLVGI
jgi:hypothetical protein